ncbi:MULTISPECIES: response regulator [Sphingomonas]|uniref:histidine kinase n=1 Tax=Sphingomonas lycopersici TaxID=2951807 RepID=A0AA41Z803_9SPHN|nr:MULTISPECIES: response regulator [Sphingomonas]MCW6534316.1 response regulator [Sphingomonas lycopersici]OJU17354.1 MAG: hybrid sensor histidine kinase/response regulator [Sphingomonas sp. 66-10]
MASRPIAPPIHLTQRSALLASLLAGGIAALIVLWLTGSAVFAGGFLGAAVVLAGAAMTWRSLAGADEATAVEVDWGLARAIAQTAADAIAITDRAGRLVCANDRYEALFGGFPAPPDLPLGEGGAAALATAGRAAWRDGRAPSGPLRLDRQTITAEVTRAGEQQDMLIWRFEPAADATRVDRLTDALAGDLGNRLGEAGIMAALIAPDGRVLSANPVLSHRALGQPGGTIEGQDFARFLITDSRGLVRFEREGLDGNPLRPVQVPFAENESEGGPILIALLDEEDAPVADGPTAANHISTLVSLMPVGIALVDREGRFVQMNEVFTRAAGIDPAVPPLYPGDLVVREDKAAVADAVRRFANGAAAPSDMAVRLRDHPEEPVVLTIAGARGMGAAAVVLSLKDNSEESRLKRQVAQATKMQAVGQLAGGVAHDFNNILTAILGHCDLMLMRHSPGDSDYDDIQQIRSNSNRAAGLTRQLLAFSRQQTLRPQVLQLPDVVSEVSNLLKRLLGETVTLNVSHGRDLGPVRADPGQLEQVVVNLAVNARDAMQAKNPHGGGTLTIRTRAVGPAEVRERGSDIMPPADYTALEISDTGTGIPQEVLPKIFEPFFTTKEVGKGTGLGLSTVYGIVKQSGGYIFADSKPGQGATFTIYLPVHAAGAVAVPRAPVRTRQAEMWGTGTVLLVEDEAMVRAVAERALSRQGYTVLSAENGEAALELLETCQAPDLLISDVVMPQMDGPTMARHVRERYPHLPILFMSGYAEEQLRKSIDLDNVAFLPKPFSVQQLGEAARDALSQA